MSPYLSTIYDPVREPITSGPSEDGFGASDSRANPYFGTYSESSDFTCGSSSSVGNTSSGISGVEASSRDCERYGGMPLVPRQQPNASYGSQAINLFCIFIDVYQRNVRTNARLCQSSTTTGIGGSMFSDILDLCNHHLMPFADSAISKWMRRIIHICCRCRSLQALFGMTPGPYLQKSLERRNCFRCTFAAHLPNR